MNTIESDNAVPVPGAISVQRATLELGTLMANSPPSSEDLIAERLDVKRIERLIDSTSDSEISEARRLIHERNQYSLEQRRAVSRLRSAILSGALSLSVRLNGESVDIPNSEIQRSRLDWNSSLVLGCFSGSSRDLSVYEGRDLYFRLAPWGCFTGALKAPEVVGGQYDHTESIDQWARSAAERGVTIANARKDAVEKLGKNAAPKQEDARALLRSARASMGVPVKLGRPTGSKSFSGGPR